MHNERTELRFYRLLSAGLIVAGLYLIGYYAVNVGIAFKDLKALGIHWVGLASNGISVVPWAFSAGRANRIATLEAIHRKVLVVRAGGQVSPPDAQWALDYYDQFSKRTLPPGSS